MLFRSVGARWVDRAGLAAAVAQLGAVLRRARHRQSCDVRDDPGETDEFRPLVDDQSLGSHRPLLPLHAEPGSGDAEEWTGGFRGSGRRPKIIDRKSVGSGTSVYVGVDLG